MIYVVQSGDTLYSIARRFGVTQEQIARDNQLYEQEALVVGQALLILGTESAMEKIGKLSVSGYAYPFINRQLLAGELFYLEELLIFSYGFTTEGNLVAPILDDLPLIRAAWSQDVRPILVLTPFGEDGQFNNYLVNLVTQDLEVQEHLIEEVLFTLQDRGYAGIDVDFEYILAADRERYVQFVARMGEVLRPLGYSVSVAVPPKISSMQKGLLYEGIDLAGLGEVADEVFLMTYEWGYTYGPPMAVAPINKVRQVVEYAVTEVSRDKLRMGIPNYAYDWPIPYQRGITAARTIGNEEAVQIAARYKAEIEFDEIGQSPYYFYTDETGVEHEVWFEDVRSVESKLRLAAEYGLLGVGYWNLMRPFLANWLLLGEVLER